MKNSQKTRWQIRIEDPTGMTRTHGLTRTEMILGRGAEVDLSPLSAEERQLYLKWKRARGAHEALSSRYWARTVALRKYRRIKSSRGEALTRDDYVLEQPPVYDGPSEPKGVLAKLKRKDRAKAGYPKAAEPILPLKACSIAASAAAPL